MVHVRAASKLRRFLPSLVLTTYVLSKKNKNKIIFHLKIIAFTAVKNCSILQRQGIVMSYGNVVNMFTLV